MEDQIDRKQVNEPTSQNRTEHNMPTLFNNWINVGTNDFLNFLSIQAGILDCLPDGSTLYWVWSDSTLQARLRTDYIDGLQTFL